MGMELADDGEVSLRFCALRLAEVWTALGKEKTLDLNQVFVVYLEGEVLED
jgi:hypothetical protein